MRHLTEETPKPLLKVNNKTFLEIIFDSLPPEVDEVVVVVKYLGDKIRQFLGDKFKGRKVSYAEGSDKGSAYSFLAAKPFIKAGERFITFYADELITKEDVAACLAYGFRWLCWEVADPRASNNLTLTPDGFITGIIEKPSHPTSNLVAGGLMIANSDIFSYVPEKHSTGEYYLTSLMDKFVKEHKVKAVIRNHRPSFSTPEDINASLKK